MAPLHPLSRAPHGGATERIGQVLAGRYRLLATIGTGASASVYLADDTNLGRQVAVKVLHDALADDEAFLRRFRAEARAAAALNHPHITAVYDWGQTGVPFLVMEYLPGGSLRTMLDRAGTLSASQTLLVGLEAARGLDYAHRRGFVHRDIKPANLLFDDESRLRIADFGLARALAEAAWTEPMGAVLGTAKYASPEQARGESLDGRSDVYALALVLVEAVSGAVPFAADTTVGTLMARVDRPLPVPEVAGPLGPVLAWAGSPDPADRPDAAAFGSALLDVASQLDRPRPLPVARDLPAVVDLTDPGVPGATAATDDITVVGGPGLAAGTAATAAGAVAGPPVGAGAPPASDPDLTVIAEPAERAPRRWGRNRVELTGRADDGEPGGDASGTTTTTDPADSATGAATGAVGAVEADPGRPKLYDYEAESDPDFLDPSGELRLPFDQVPRRRTPRRDRREARRTTVPGSRRRWPRRLGLAALGVALVGVVVAAFVAFGTFGWQVSAVPRAPVPAFVGQPLTAAEQAATANGWTLVKAEARADNTEPGQVLDQAPAAGTELDKGGVVHLTVSLGPPLVDVPADLAGKTLDQARQRLNAAGLNLGDVQRQPSEDVAADTVIGLAPGVGGPLAKGTGVALVVSAGPPPRTIPQGLAGKDADDVVRQLKGLGLVPSTASDSSDTVPKGSVISVKPGSGAQVPKGATVTVIVSSGPPIVAVPDVKGLSVEDAATKIEAAGLTVSGTSGSPSKKAAGTDPPAGTTVKKGSTVTITTG